jgi:hypothetical protein
LGLKRMESVEGYLKEGYVIVNDGMNYTTLKYPKKFSVLAFILWTLFFSIFGMIGYILYYALRKEGTVTVKKKSPRKKKIKNKLRNKKE